MTSTNEKKELREKTGAGIMTCKKALVQADGDMQRALELLREQGLAKAQKKAQREAREGLVETYIHTGGRIGALVEVNCETDFVARTDEFKELARNVAMQVAAMDPSYLSKEDLDNDDLPQDEELNPAEVCLLVQPFIRDSERTVQDIITDAIAKVGENIKVRRFARFELGKD